MEVGSFMSLDDHLSGMSWCWIQHEKGLDKRASRGHCCPEKGRSFDKFIQHCFPENPSQIESTVQAAEEKRKKLPCVDGKTSWADTAFTRARQQEPKHKVHRKGAGRWGRIRGGNKAGLEERDGEVYSLNDRGVKDKQGMFWQGGYKSE